MPEPNKKTRRWAKRLPEATHAEWVRPGSDWDKIRQAQGKSTEAKAENAKRKEKQRARKKQATEAYRLRGEQCFDECLEAVEQEDIQTAREEIRRDLRR